MPSKPAETISGTRRIAVIPGDGIGVEVTREALKVLKAAASGGPSKLEFTEFDWGAERYLRDGTTLPEGAIQMLRRDFDAILFGAIGDPRVPANKHAADILLGMRTRLDLYVNLRPVELFDHALTPLRGRGTTEVNFVVLRENTEGLYAGVGGNSSTAPRTKLPFRWTSIHARVSNASSGMLSSMQAITIWVGSA